MTQNKTFESVIIDVSRLLGGDPNKACFWFGTKNPLLGGFSPIEMVIAGMGEKLLAFIQNAIDENKSLKEERESE